MRPVAGQSVVKSMPRRCFGILPCLPLSRLHHRLGDAEPEGGTPAPPEKLKVPLPDWMSRSGEVRPQHGRGASAALAKPGEARPHHHSRGRPVGPLFVVKNILYALVPSPSWRYALVVWWYVVITSRQARLKPLREAQPLGGAPAVEDTAPKGSAENFGLWFGIVSAFAAAGMALYYMAWRPSGLKS